MTPASARSMKETPAWLLYGVLGAALVAVFLGSLLAGPTKVSLWNAITHPAADLSFVFWDIRLPRALLGLLVGATLGLAGATMQGFLRNPLAEPGILGVTGGAAVGAVAVFYTGIATAFPMLLPMGGILGAFISVLLLYLFAGTLASVQTLILAGVAINVLAFSGTSLMLNLVRDPYAVLDIVFWQMGSLADRSLDHIFLILPFVLVGWCLLLWDGRALEALMLDHGADAIHLRIEGREGVLGDGLVGHQGRDADPQEPQFRPADSVRKHPCGHQVEQPVGGQHDKSAQDERL